MTTPTRLKRFGWLIDVIRARGYNIGAEIGVHKGNTTHKVLQGCKRLQLIAVDKWEDITPDSSGEKIGCEADDMSEMKRIFDKRTKDFKDRLTVLHGDSVEMASKVEDNSLDFVFIDGDHRYESVKADIRAWAPKLRPGGMLSGHDIDYPSVLRAVSELVPNFKDVGVNAVWEAKKEDYVDRSEDTV
jgi:hypothetical protein